MSATTELALPEPARALWLRTRDAIRTSLEELGGAEYEMGGGTVLAARWGHRVSYDVDLTLPDTLPLYRLENPVESRFEHRMRELGGRPEYFRSLRMYQVRFGDQGLDLWAHAVQPPGSQSRLRIEGREETVHSNVQAALGQDCPRRAESESRRLRPRASRGARPREPGDRGERTPARHGRVGGAQLGGWRHSDRLRRRRATAGNPGRGADATRHARRAGRRTIKAVLYEELSIRTAGDRLQIETRTAGGVHRRKEIETGRIREALIARGLTGDRRRYGPNTEALLEYAEALCRERAAATLIYREDARRATHWRTATATHNLPAGPPI